MSDTDIAPYLPESIDKMAPCTVATTYCTGRVTVDYPVNWVVARAQYIRKVTSACKREHQNVLTPDSPPVHIKRVDLLRRDEKGEIINHIDTRHDVPTCDCSPVTTPESSDDSEE